jgi:hypothetical protein
LARPYGVLFWNYQDVDTVSHEISEWANDRFATNFVETPVPKKYLGANPNAICEHRPLFVHGDFKPLGL